MRAAGISVLCVDVAQLLLKVLSFFCDCWGCHVPLYCWGCHVPLFCPHGVPGACAVVFARGLGENELGEMGCVHRGSILVVRVKSYHTVVTYTPLERVSI